MNRWAFVAGATAVLVVAVMSGGLRVGFPSWIPLPRPTEVPPATVPVPVPVPPLPVSLDAPPSTAAAGDHVRVEATLTHGRLLQGGPGEVFLVAQLQATAAPARPAEGRPRLNVALVIDKSGSMEAGGTMDQVKAACRNLLEHLTAQDRVAVVCYATEAEVLVPSQAPTNLEKLLRIIDGIEPTGATNLSEGLELGVREVKKSLDANAINRVLLLSDGKANMGVVDPGQLADMARAAVNEGVSLSTLGLGKEFNERLLQDLADYGRGNYYFMAGASQILAVFQRELQGLATAVAKDVDLVVEPADGVTVERVYGYKPVREAGTVTVPVGALSGGQGRKVVLRLRVPVDRQGGRAAAKVSLRYADLLEGGKARVERLELGLAVVDDAAAVEAARSREALARAEAAVAAEGLEEAIDRVEANRDQEAGRMLRERIEASRRINQTYYRDPELDGQLKAMEGLLQNLDGAAMSQDQRAIMVKQGRAQSYEMRR